MTKLQIIVGSTRAERAADNLVPWITERTTTHGGFDVEVLDLRDWPLPMFAETAATIGDRADPTFSEPIVKRWNVKIAEGEAYLFVTPEYNHSVPGVLKNAIDSVFVTMAFRNKPAAFVGYSGGAVGAARAVEHLAHIAIEMEAVPLRDTVLIGGVAAAFDAEHNPTNPMTDMAMQVMLDDLSWWAELLTPARAHQLPPGKFRMMQAMAARSSS